MVEGARLEIAYSVLSRIVGSNPTYSAIKLVDFDPTPDEQRHRDFVMRRILDHVRDDVTIKLPAFDPTLSRPSDQFALLSVGLEENDFRGSVGPYCYQFEGEEDLLHLMVTRANGEPLTAEEGQQVASFALPGVPAALIWLRPGEFSQHFFLGHDDIPGV